MLIAVEDFSDLDVKGEDGKGCAFWLSLDDYRAVAHLFQTFADFLALPDETH
jgi:hypothetical protein